MIGPPPSPSAEAELPRRRHASLVTAAPRSEARDLPWPLLQRPAFGLARDSPDERGPAPGPRTGTLHTRSTPASRGPELR